MQQWEYKKEVLNVLSAERLNELGAKGWEFIIVHGNCYFFKRMKESMKDDKQVLGLPEQPKDRAAAGHKKQPKR